MSIESCLDFLRRWDKWMTVLCNPEWKEGKLTCIHNQKGNVIKQPEKISSNHPKNDTFVLKHFLYNFQGYNHSENSLYMLKY